VAAVDEEERQRGVPQAGDRRRRPHDEHHVVFQTAILEGLPGEGQGVHTTGPRIDDGAVVVLPACLVLLRAPVVVDGQEHRAAVPGRGAQVHGGFAAVGPDLEERTKAGAGCRHPGPIERRSLVVRHEALDRPGVGEELGLHYPGMPVRPSRAGGRSSGWCTKSTLLKRMNLPIQRTPKAPTYTAATVPVLRR